MTKQVNLFLNGLSHHEECSPLMTTVLCRMLDTKKISHLVLTSALGANLDQNGFGLMQLLHSSLSAYGRTNLSEAGVRIKVYLHSPTDISEFAYNMLYGTTHKKGLILFLCVVPYDTISAVGLCKENIRLLIFGYFLSMDCKYPCMDCRCMYLYNMYIRVWFPSFWFPTTKIPNGT
jgi:hypothetical protein